MPISDARKRANDKWNKANMAVISCKVNKETALKFKTACQKNDVTPNSVLRRFIAEYISEENIQDTK